MVTDHSSPDPTPTPGAKSSPEHTGPKMPFAGGPSRRILAMIAGAVVVVLVAVIAIVVASGGGDGASLPTTSEQEAGGPPPVQTISGSLVVVDASGAKDAKAKVAGRQVGLWTIKNGKPDRETQTAVTGGTGSFFFLKTDTVKPGARFLIKAEKGDPIEVTIPAKGALKATLKVCYSCG